MGPVDIGRVVGPPTGTIHEKLMGSRDAKALDRLIGATMPLDKPPKDSSLVVVGFC